MHILHGPTPRGVGGLKLSYICTICKVFRPTPRGVGGLKYVDGLEIVAAAESHPSRGGWIEIRKILPHHPHQRGPTPRGVGGLKWVQT